MADWGWNSAWDFLTGKPSKGNSVGSQVFQWFTNPAGKFSESVGLNDALENIYNNVTGADLTGAQKKEMAFNEAQANTAYARNVEAQKSQFDYEREMADLKYQRDLDMANTAYQRQVADLKAAGLNPYLAYQQGGAQVVAQSVPAGVGVSVPSASVGLTSGNFASSLSALGYTALALSKILPKAVSLGKLGFI